MKGQKLNGEEAGLKKKNPFVSSYWFSSLPFGLQYKTLYFYLVYKGKGFQEERAGFASSASSASSARSASLKKQNL
jgi:hypothetical protein